MDERRKQLVAASLDRRTRSQVVGEHDHRSKKHVVFDSHTIEQEDAIFDRDAVTNRDTAFHVCVVADIAITPDFGAGENMCECPDSGSSADMVALTQSVWVDIDAPRYTRVHDKITAGV
ncbi:hypothetical protein ASG82_23655 [Mycobacterium sp. Soil538]|nr:hypothetical protein ASG82_23655 [Mycobacterium sp. Soil538]